MIKYKSGYKYQLVKDYGIKTKILGFEAHTRYINLSKDGFLLIKESYCWDGPSGPTIDTKNFMRGSLIHDALYQLIREGLLDSKWRRQADKELRKACLEDGMSKIRAWYVYHCVRKFADFAADPKHRKPILTAPVLLLISLFIFACQHPWAYP